MFRFAFASCAIIATFAAVTAQTPRTDLIKELLDLPAPAPVAERPATLAVTSRPVLNNGLIISDVPADDAPIIELLNFWQTESGNFNSLRYSPKPSARTVERLLELCNDTPVALASLINVFPDDPETVGKIKSLRQPLKEKSPRLVGEVDKWLKYHSDFAVDELVAASEKVADKDEYVTNQEDLLALARIDWTRAEPIVERLINDKKQPVSSALAKWALYRHALIENNELDISKYRRQLQDIVEDSKQSDGIRDLAFDALCKEAEWDGRDDWYFTLLEDETLFELKVNGRSFTGLTTLLLYSPPEKYAKKMIQLVESRSPVVRKMAIRNLASIANAGNPDVIRALLPWLSNPDWAPDINGTRAVIIRSLGKIKMPESVPGLIFVLLNEPRFMMDASSALAQNRDIRAAPALRKIATENPVIYLRGTLINALDACGGISDEEKMASLEKFAELLPTGDPQEVYRSIYNTTESAPKSLAVSIGVHVSDSRLPTDSFARLALARQKVLRRTKPAIASIIDGFIKTWRGPVINAELLRRIRSGENDLADILAVLARRSQIREDNAVDLGSLGAVAGLPHGIAACMANGESEAINVLRQPDNVAKSAMLGCARLLRIKLPVADVGDLINDKDARLSLAAERYLESEDSVDARALILAKHPGKARILGALEAFYPEGVSKGPVFGLSEVFESLQLGRADGSGAEQIEKFEKSLRDELLANADLVVVYGMIENKSSGHDIVRVYRDRVVFSNYEDAARFRERALTKHEFEDFQRLVIDENIDGILPFTRDCLDCPAAEFVMFSKAGGRRVYAQTTYLGDPLIKLRKYFNDLPRDGMKLHYKLKDRIPGLEVLMADDQFPARSIWKNGNDFRVLIEDLPRRSELKKNLEAEIEAERTAAEKGGSAVDWQRLRNRTRDLHFTTVEWRSVLNGQAAGAIANPPGNYVLPDLSLNFGDGNLNEAWQPPSIRAGDTLIKIRPSDESDPGLYRISRETSPSLVIAGNYDAVVVASGGRWAIAVREQSTREDKRTLVRVDLTTGREIAIAFPAGENLNPRVSIPGQNKILVTLDDGTDSAEDLRRRKASAKSEFYVVDMETGVYQTFLKGSLEPLLQQTFRMLQPTGVANEFWAAVCDEKTNETAIGRYDVAKFEFRPLVKLPEIKLTSMDIWVDEKESKIYFTYEGHLLSVPLAAVTR